MRSSTKTRRFSVLLASCSQPGAHKDSLSGIDVRDGQKLAARVE
jgi:hypothetical protein